jgi:cell division protein FtsX
MKETLKRFLFSIRYAYKNIVKNPLRSVLLILSLLALVTSLLLASSSRNFMTEYFLGDLRSQYQDLDLVVSVGTAGNARYFTIRTLNENPDQLTYIKEAIPFFEVNTLVDVGDEKVYVNVMSSSIHFFKRVSAVHASRLELSESQVIITKSLADEYQLSHGETLSMHLGSSSKNYVIADIIPDGGLFSGRAIYLNKEYSLPFFLTALNPALSGFPSIFFANLYNTLYIDIQEDQTVETVSTYLQGLSGYSNLYVRETINLDEVTEMIDRNMAVFSVIFIIVIFSILLVMSTTMKVYFEDKKKMVAIINLLGGSSRLSYGVILFEFMLFFIISAFLSIWIAQEIVTFGMTYVGSKSSYTLKPLTVFFTLGIAFFIFLGASLRYYLHAKRTSSIVEVRESVQKDPISIRWYLILSVVSSLVYGLAQWIDLGEVGVLIRILAITSILFVLPFMLFKIIVFYQATSTLMFHLKMLIDQQSFRHYVSVLLLSFLSIFLLALTNTHMEERFTSHRAEYKVDYVLTNFITGYDETTLEIQNMPEVHSANQALLYENITFPDYGDSMLLTVSMEPSTLDQYFGIDLSDASLAALDMDIPTIILPVRYQKLYGLQIGDSIIANIHPLFPNVEMAIGGFFEKYIANLAFTNLHTIGAFSGTGIRSIFVNEASDSSHLDQLLISNYSQNLVYVLDYQALVESNVQRMERATLYMTIILGAIIICFVLSIVNHSLLLLSQMRKNDARMHILGLSRTSMISLMIHESLWLFIVLITGSLLSFVLLSMELTELILWSGEYENIQLSGTSIVYGMVLIVILFICTRMVYIIKLLNIRPSNVLRNYE